MLGPDVVTAAADHPCLGDGLADFLIGLRPEHRYPGPTAPHDTEPFPYLVDGLEQVGGVRLAAKSRTEWSERCAWRNSARRSWPSHQDSVVEGSARRCRSLRSHTLRWAGSGSWSGRAAGALPSSGQQNGSAFDTGRGRVEL